MVTALLIVATLASAEWAWRRSAAASTEGTPWPRRALPLIAPTAALLAVFVSLPNGALLGKVIGVLAMPAGLLWMALVLMTALHVHRRATLAAALTALTLCAYTALGNTWVGASLMRSLEAPYVETDPLAEAPFDAVLVLGGGTRTTDDGRPQVTQAGDRLIVGARMWHAGVTPILITSGSTTPGANRMENAADATRQIWTQLGVAPDAIVELSEPHNTRMEVAAFAALAQERGWQRTGLVSSAFHLRRAMRLAAAEGLDVVPLPADFRGMRSWDGFLSLVPQAVGFSMVQYACWERLGAATGR